MSSRTCPSSSLGSLPGPLPFLSGPYSRPLSMWQRRWPQAAPDLYLMTYALQWTESISFNISPCKSSLKGRIDYRFVFSGLNQLLFTGNSGPLGQAWICTHPSNLGWPPHGPYNLGATRGNFPRKLRVLLSKEVGRYVWWGKNNTCRLRVLNEKFLLNSLFHREWQEVFGGSLREVWLCS